jgi:hypothetical protein
VGTESAADFLKSLKPMPMGLGIGFQAARQRFKAEAGMMNNYFQVSFFSLMHCNSRYEYMAFFHLFRAATFSLTGSPFVGISVSQFFHARIQSLDRLVLRRF